MGPKRNKNQNKILHIFNSRLLLLLLFFDRFIPSVLLFLAECYSFTPLQASQSPENETIWLFFVELGIRLFQNWRFDPLLFLSMKCPWAKYWRTLLATCMIAPLPSVCECLCGWMRGKNCKPLTLHSIKVGKHISVVHSPFEMPVCILIFITCKRGQV